jgi:hypothetical protein
MQTRLDLSIGMTDSIAGELNVQDLSLEPSLIQTLTAVTSQLR